jgi:hypothetical protein
MASATRNVRRHRRASERRSYRGAIEIERERLELEKEQSEKRVREKVEKLQKQLAKKRKGGISKKALREIERAAHILR